MWHPCKCLISQHTFAFSSFLCSYVFLWKFHHHFLAVRNWLEINLIAIHLIVSSHATCGSFMIVSVHFLCLLIIYSPHCSWNDFFFLSKNKSDHEPSLFKTLYWLPFAYRLRTEILTVASRMGLCRAGLCLPCSWALAFFILHPSTFLEHLI